MGSLQAAESTFNRLSMTERSKRSEVTSNVSGTVSANAVGKAGDADAVSDNTRSPCWWRAARA